MSLTVKEAARLYGVGESRIRSAIADGTLTVERKGRQILIPETEIKALAETVTGMETANHNACFEPGIVPCASRNKAFALIESRLTDLERQLREQWRMAADNQRLHELLREQDRRLAEEELELARLQRDLIEQRRLAAKEREDLQLAFREQLAQLEQDGAARTAREQERMAESLAHERQSCAVRLAREREEMEQLLARERQNSAEKLAQEQERFAQMGAAMRNQEGFWARLVRMITWG